MPTMTELYQNLTEFYLHKKNSEKLLKSSAKILQKYKYTDLMKLMELWRRLLWISII